MSDVTRILSAMEQGDSSGAEQLLPLVYDELRKLAAHRLAGEKSGQTLQATALVHEAYLRLVDVEKPQHWNGRGHFFAAAAEAMRRILVDRARRKKRIKHGGAYRRVELAEQDLLVEPTPDDLLSLDEALGKLAQEDPKAADIVKLHVFAGLSIDEAADALGMSRASGYRQWTYARAWLRCEMDGPEANPAG